MNPTANPQTSQSEQDERSAERLARAALSRLMEPGDTVGFGAVQAWGAPRALQVLTGGDRPGADERQELTLVLEAEGLRLSERSWTQSLQRWAARAGSLAPERDLQTMHRLGGGLLIPADEHWPTALADLGAAAPIGLWFRGGAVIPDAERTLAVVGSRDATSYGQVVTRQLAGGAASRGLTVLSGGAYGIDAAAHRAALEAGPPGSLGTVAVLAGGLDRYYPAGNEPLLRAVQDRGLLLSELAPGSSPTRYRFLQRNRLIAALAGAVLVVEARWRSGAQNTAGHALGLGREVGVVPGPITSAASAGCHRLLRQSPAVVVTDVEEVLELLPGSTERVAPGPGSGAEAGQDPRAGANRPHDHLTVEQLLVYEALPLRSGAPVDRLCAVAGLGAGIVVGTLQRLQRDGLCEQVGGGWRRTAR